MKLGIVGHGVVGRHLEELFNGVHQNIVIYDKHVEPYSSTRLRSEINKCDLVFIAVPTPALPDGRCDTSNVEEVAQWVIRPMCIKSTVPPGTTDLLATRTGKQIVFSPEYVGETAFHKYKSAHIPDLVVVGGAPATADLVIATYKDALGPEPHYFETDALTAELAKYMENCFFATKVAFAAQFAMLAESCGVNFTQLREIWLADTRIGRSHSTVIGAPGFGGRCLPKDLSAIIRYGQQMGVHVDLLEAVQQYNRYLRNR